VTILKLLRLADAFTIANAALGFLAITYISDAKYLNAEVLLLLAVVADGVDGIVARRFGGGKESMGDYLDIMADYLSFCVAPAILFYQVYFDVAATPFQTLPQDILVGLGSALLVLFGLLRLARHVAKKGPEAGRFTGLPTTGAGLLTVLLIAEGGLGDVVTALIVALAALLMVTEIPYPKVRGPAAVASGGAVIAAAAVLPLFPPGAAIREAVLLVALAGAAAYAVSGVAFGLARIPLGHGEAAPPPSSTGKGTSTTPRATPSATPKRPRAPKVGDESQEIDPDA
jgi:archaetidylserine synthase